MTMSRDEIFAKVQAVLVEALSVEDEEVVASATLQADLGAESLDVLDIVFQLEKAFSIKIPEGDLNPASILNNPEYVSGDRLTAAGLARLKELMPHADFTEYEKEPTKQRMPDLLTVNTLVNYLESKLKAA
jgi:acyl carrier protein